MRWILASVLATAATLGTASPASAGDGFIEFRWDAPRVRIEVRRSEPCRYVAGRWVERVERVVVREGYWRRVVEPARYSWRFDFHCRRFVRVCVQEETVRREWVPAVVEERCTRTWVPARWDCACSHHR